MPEWKVIYPCLLPSLMAALQAILKPPVASDGDSVPSRTSKRGLADDEHGRSQHEGPKPATVDARAGPSQADEDS